MLTGEDNARVLDLLRQDAQQAYAHYQEMLNLDDNGEVLDDGRTGLARELARMNLSLNYYSQWYWKIDLHNLLHFLSLRADDHAQFEIREYADVMMETVKQWVPQTFAAFQDYRMAGANLSAKGLAVVKRMLAGEDVTQEESGISKREWIKLMAQLGREA